jgi:hypothetical protein
VNPSSFERLPDVVLDDGRERNPDGVLGVLTGRLVTGRRFESSTIERRTEGVAVGAGVEDGRAFRELRMAKSFPKRASLLDVEAAELRGAAAGAEGVGVGVGLGVGVGAVARLYGWADCAGGLGRNEEYEANPEDARRVWEPDFEDRLILRKIIRAKATVITSSATVAMPMKMTLEPSAAADVEATAGVAGATPGSCCMAGWPVSAAV